MNTFYWHDYETWGVNPAIDRPSQFAGVRTDQELNIIGEPLVCYCQPPEDIWPNPEACLVTGITPQRARDQGLCEVDFIGEIHRELARPNTCSVGYNSIRFDEEVTRYTLYRNFFDPYEREWKNGNSRWDIIDMLRLTYALRPEGIEWPLIDGRPSFKLEHLTCANGIDHGAAHDAYSDVAATIALAKLVKQRKPDLYDYVLKNKAKQQVAALIDIKNNKPLLHISAKFRAENGCAALIAPIAMHPVNKNAAIAFDLSYDPSPLAALSAAQIHERVFSANKDLPEGVTRLPIKLIHFNKCPVLLTPKILTEQIAQRLKIDKAQCEANWQKLLRMDVQSKLRQMYELDDFVQDPDPETQLYAGFINNQDKKLMAEFRQAKSDELAQRHFVFADKRLNDMSLCYRARNFPGSLSEAERGQWQEHVSDKLLRGGPNRLSEQSLRDKIADLRILHQDDQDKLAILQALQAYVDESLLAKGLK